MKVLTDTERATVYSISKEKREFATIRLTHIPIDYFPSNRLGHEVWEVSSGPWNGCRIFDNIEDAYHDYYDQLQKIMKMHNERVFPLWNENQRIKLKT